MVAKQKRKEDTQARMKEEPTTLEKFQREPEAQRLGHQRNSSASQGVLADCGASEDWYISGVPPPGSEVNMDEDGYVPLRTLGRETETRDMFTHYHIRRHQK